MTTPDTDGYINGVRPMSAYERRVWSPEFQAAYERTRDLTHDERRFLTDGYLAAVRIKAAQAREAAAKQVAA